MDLNSENNLEMAEVLLSALNPAARATLWLKMTEDGNNINGLPYQNCIKTEPGRSKRRYSERFGSRKGGAFTTPLPSPEPQIITIPLQEIPEIEDSTRSWKGLFDIDTISNNMARLLLAFKMIGLLTCGVWMNFADNIPATVKSGMIICAIGVVIHFCIVCIVSNRITLILTLLLGIFEGFFFWIILAYIDAMETFLLCRIERSGLILSISSDYKSVYPNGCSDCDIIEAWHQRGMIPTNCTHFVAGNDTGSDPGSFPRGHVDVN